jgi:hypothetical protein
VLETALLIRALEDKSTILNPKYAAYRGRQARHLIDIVIDDVVYEILCDVCWLTPLQRGHHVLLVGEEGLGEGACRNAIRRQTNAAEDLVRPFTLARLAVLGQPELPVEHSPQSDQTDRMVRYPVRLVLPERSPC